MSTDSPSDDSKDSYMLDHSNPHPARMGEIYIDQLYHVMSEIRWGDGDNRPLVDITKLPPLVITRPERVRVPEVLGRWRRKALRPLTQQIDKLKKTKPAEEQALPTEEQTLPVEEPTSSDSSMKVATDSSGEGSGSSDNSRKGSLSSLSLSVGKKLKTVVKPSRH